MGEIFRWGNTMVSDFEIFVRKIDSMKTVQIPANCRYVLYILQMLFYKNMRKDEY